MNELTDSQGKGNQGGDPQTGKNLQTLTKDQLTERLAPFLTKKEISTLDKRRQKLIKHFKSLIKKQGYAKVIVNAELPDFAGLSAVQTDPAPSRTH